MAPVDTMVVLCSGPRARCREALSIGLLHAYLNGHLFFTMLTLTHHDIEDFS